MSKKKRYFLNDPIAVANGQISIGQNHPTEFKQQHNSSKPICIGELEDRCLIKIPNQKNEQHQQKTALGCLVEAFKKKKLSKCKVISVFGAKKCPPPPVSLVKTTSELSSNSIEQTKKKDSTHNPNKVDLEIDRLASLLKVSVDSSNSKKKVEITTAPPPPSILVPKTAHSKKQEHKRLNKKQQQQVAAKSTIIKTKKNENDLSKQVDAEIEKLVSILNESKEKIINKLNSKLSKKISEQKSDLKSKVRSIKTGLIPGLIPRFIYTSIESIFPSNLDKLATIFKEPIKRKKSIKKLTTNNDQLKQEKDLPVTIVDKKTLLKLKKIDNSKEKLKKIDSTPSNLLKEIKLFKQEKENIKQSSYVSKLRSQLKEKLEKEKASLSSTISDKPDSCPVIIKKKEENSKVVTLLKEKQSKLVKLLAGSLNKKEEKSKLKNELLVQTDNKSVVIEEESRSKLIDTSNISSTIITSTENSSIILSELEVKQKNTPSTKIIISKEPKKIQNDPFRKVTEARNKILAILSKQIQSSILNTMDNELPALKIESETETNEVNNSSGGGANSPILMIEDTERSDETPVEIVVRSKIVHLGVVETNPDEYMKKFGNSLVTTNSLPQYILDIKPPEGITLAADNPTQARPVELVGEVDALKLVDPEILEREGLGDYKNNN